MDRNAALSYLTSEFAELACDAQFSDDQKSTAYATAIDMALRQLGVAETALPTYDVPQAQIMPYLALLTYYALKRFARLLSVRVQVTVPGPASAARQQAFQQVNILLAQAQADLVALGVDLGNAHSFQLGRLNLDFEEPSVTGEYASYWWTDGIGGW